MKLFKILTVLGLFLSQDLLAGFQREGNHEVVSGAPRVLRGVHVEGERLVVITGRSSLGRKIAGKFGQLSSEMNWSIYLLENPKGVFWNEEATDVIKKTKSMGFAIDVDPSSSCFSLTEEILKNQTIKAGDFEMNLWEALLKYQINEAGILVITL